MIDGLGSIENFIDVEKQHYSNRIYDRLLSRKDILQFYSTSSYALSQRSFESASKQELPLGIVVKDAKTFTSIITIEILTISKPIKQESKSSLAFQAYSNVSITCYPSIGKSHTLCLDINSRSILISERAYQAFYSHISHYLMAENKRLRCKGVGEIVTSTLCARIPLRLKNDKGRMEIVIEEAHIVPSLPCDVIAKIELLKPNRMMIEWDENEGDQDYVLFRDRRFLVQATSIVAPLVVEEAVSTPVLMAKASVVRLAKRYHPRVRNVIVYALETTILNLDKGKNVLMRHKPLLVGASYLFQAFPHMHPATGELVIAISAMIESN